MTDKRRSALQPSFVEDCGDVIEEIAIALPQFILDKDQGAAAAVLAMIGNLVASFKPHMHVLLLCEGSGRARAEAWLSHLALRCSATLVDVGEGALSKSGFWIQDCLHVRIGCDGYRIGDTFTDNANSLARWLARQQRCTWERLELHMAGGNHLVGPDFRIVGFDSIRLSAARHFGGDSGLQHALDRIQALDARPVHVFGFRADELRARHAGSPAPHLPTAGLTAVAASICQADRWYQFGLHVDQFVSITGLSQSGQPLLLIADPVSPSHPHAAQVVSAKRQIDACARHLSRAGFAVLRNPVPFAPGLAGQRFFPRLYNNVIVENGIRPGEAKPLVWMPSFGENYSLLAFDNENVALWHSLGFDVILVGGAESVAEHGGALRCVSKVLRRKGRAMFLPDNVNANNASVG